MIRLVEALNYRCLRYVRQPLDAFHVLVGPNASGKSSFLDVLGFLSRFMLDGLEAAVGSRSSNFSDLLWNRKGNRFELAVEAKIPGEGNAPSYLTRYDIIRYEIAIGFDSLEKIRILDERIWLRKEDTNPITPGNGHLVIPETLFHPGTSGRGLVRKFEFVQNRNEYALSVEDPIDEVLERDDDIVEEQGWDLIVKQSSDKSLLAALDSGEFPGAAWLYGVLSSGVRYIDLESKKLRNPSPPGKGDHLQSDGSNLPQTIATLRRTNLGRCKAWLKHVRMALPDVADVLVKDREEDKHRYIMAKYHNGLEVPSWMLSEGTLRLLALTIIPYAKADGQIYLVEEPENSIHPLNIEAVIQSLESVYDGQILTATQSPTVLAVSKPEKILVFSRNEEHGTQVVRGDQHPRLQDWKGQPNLSVLFASGVLG